jgi:hypothetical protein
LDPLTPRLLDDRGLEAGRLLDDFAVLVDVLLISGIGKSVGAGFQ